MVAACTGDLQDPFTDLPVVHAGNVRYLEPMPVERADIQEFFQVTIVVVSYVGIRTFWDYDIVTLLLHPDGMGLDAAQFFQVVDGIAYHDAGGC